MSRKNVLYARLSVSDINRELGSFSDSIDNQISYINEYCERENILLDDFYVDDGYSGSNFERPQFKKLINDVEDNKISLILIKDISRLGRNFVDVLYYINQFFPSHGVKIIAINDNYDSRNMENNYIDSVLRIKSFINEKYIKDVSKKIKQVKLHKTEDKNYLGVVAPYGYLRVAKDGRNTLEVDNKVCAIVKRIFLDVACGKCLSDVAYDLNKDKIISPGAYMGVRDADSKWTEAIIYRIIRNVIYCGNMFYRKSEKYDFRQKKRKHVFLCDRKIIKNTHPKIISKNLFDLANQKIRLNHKKTVCSYKSVLVGKVYCGNCGIKCILSRKEKKDEKVYYFFYCPNHKNGCNRTISEYKLKHIVFETLKAVILKSFDVHKVVTALVENKFSRSFIENTIKTLSECINHNAFFLQDLYFKLVSGEINTLKFKEEKMFLAEQKRNFEREIGMLQNGIFKYRYEEKLRREFNNFIYGNSFIENYFNYFVDNVNFYKNGNVEIKFLFSNSQQMEIGTI